MKLKIWFDGGSSHSAYYWIVAVFQSVEKAREFVEKFHSILGKAGEDLDEKKFIELMEALGGSIEEYARFYCSKSPLDSGDQRRYSKCVEDIVQGRFWIIDYEEVPRVDIFENVVTVNVYTGDLFDPIVYILEKAGAKKIAVLGDIIVNTAEEIYKLIQQEK